MAKPIQVPYLQDGTIPHAVYSWNKKDIVLWKGAEPFHAVLKFDSFYHGRSSVTVFWKNVMTGARYPMCLSWFGECMERGSFQEVRGAILDGLWGIQKQGSYYSIFPIFQES